MSMGMREQQIILVFISLETKRSCEHPPLSTFPTMWEELMLRACETNVNCDRIKDYYQHVFMDKDRKEKDY